jgi:hypothetical protein
VDSAAFDLYFECRLAFIDLPDARIGMRDEGPYITVEVIEDRRAQYAADVPPDLYDPFDPNSALVELYAPAPVEAIPPQQTRARIERRRTARASAREFAARLRRERDLSRARIMEHA